MPKLLITAWFCLITLGGCAQAFTAKTNVSLTVSKDGTCTATYSSDKEQTGLEASVCGGKVSVDKSGTLESVVAATAVSQAMMLQILNKLTDLIPAAAKGGALAGS